MYKQNLASSPQSHIPSRIFEDRFAEPNHSSAGILPPPIIEAIRMRDYAAACDALRTLRYSALIGETIGVCLMRCGQIDAAISLFRDLALTRGTTVMRIDASDSLRLNFATALMLSGTPSGALEVLQELSDPYWLPAIRVKSAITQWTNGLSWWQRLSWALGSLSTQRGSIAIDFEPGEFPIQIAPTPPAFDTPWDPDQPKRTDPRLAA